MFVFFMSGVAIRDYFPMLLEKIQTATAWYYNGPTLEGVNQRYASDPDWHTKVYSYMEMLYNRLS